MTADVFEFRDFSMRQASSGQRVNTDSCVFGAVIGRDVKPRRALDIGTGTGVLTLMLAVRDPDVLITAVEPELEIADVARENFTASPWRDRIHLLTLRAQDLDPGIHGQFDFVFCNPPYFQNSMISDDRLRMVARHNTDLSPDELYQAMNRVMSDNGTAWVSFPGDSFPLWMESGRNAGLHPIQVTTVKDHPDAIPHMVIVGWSRHAFAEIVENTIFYRDSHKGNMSAWMKSFRDDWYPARYNAQFNLSPKINIRLIAKDDNSGIAEVIRTVMPEFGAIGPGFAIHDPEVSCMFDSYNNSASAYFVLTKNERVIGGGGIAPLTGGDQDTCELRKMYFLSEARGHGNGQMLLEKCLRQAKEIGYKFCYLETLENMEKAKRLYERNGFKKLRAPMGATGHFSCDAWYLKDL